MSQQIIDISTPDDGLGDVLRTGFDKTNKNFTELYNGKVDKIAGKGLSKNDFTDLDKAKLDGIEEGAEVNVQSDWGETDPLSDSFILNKPPSLYSAFGYFHVADLATQTTPLAFVASTPLQLTNDGGGAFTNYEQAPYGISSVWNTSTNKFEFAKLSVGDGVLFRADLSISTTSVNQNLRLYIKFGVGTASEYDLLIDSWNEKSVVTFEQFIKDVSFSIDNEDWRDAPAHIYILSDDDGEVKVNGWYVPIIRKSVNVIDFNSDPLKLDKDTTAGVERAYIINADGSQGTKATSEFKDILEFADFDAFPTTGETGKIYVALDSGFTYRWSGSVYVPIGGGGKRTWMLSFTGVLYFDGNSGNGNWLGLNATSASTFGLLGGTNGIIFQTPLGAGGLPDARSSARVVPYHCKIKSFHIRNGVSPFSAVSPANFRLRFHTHTPNGTTTLNNPVLQGEFNSTGFNMPANYVYPSSCFTNNNFTLQAGDVITPIMRGLQALTAGALISDFYLEFEEI